ncbi:hypothetical protein FNH05_27215 [Amycolatopsis rhizosphaerae]|uniref:Mce-associated membrane protein n=1 Tax=Amycolatopsis rhizosphaerae TaxID=2053003 RepID=A0A558B9W4_9PSEU|nr:hypothetical protein [Amycolatopsis rhizosphaerae]TVT33312.1 hypothetical protein FNH05_27215 [Amycolatopsis rhizosphaerae]
MDSVEPSLRRDRWVFVLVAVVAVVVVAAVTVTALVTPLADGQPPPAPSPAVQQNAVATTRDAVLATAEHAALELTTVDYRIPDEIETRQKAVAAESLQLRIADDFPKYADEAKQRQTVVTPTVAASALSALDSAQGTATALVYLAATVSQNGGAAYDKRVAVTLELRRTGEGWKVADIRMPYQG